MLKVFSAALLTGVLGGTPLGVISQTARRGHVPALLSRISHAGSRQTPRP
jgi:hypothetical protein